MNIQELIRLHYEAWTKADKYVIPDLQDALCFLTEEVGEVMDAYMRLSGSPYFRHHPHQSTEEDVATELFDVVYMACMALDVLGADLVEVAQRKLGYGDAKRDLWYDPEAGEFRPVIGVDDMGEDGIYSKAGGVMLHDVDAEYDRWVAEDEEIGRRLLGPDDENDDDTTV